MSIGDLVQDKNYNKVGYRYYGLIIDGPHYIRRKPGLGQTQYWTVLWNNGKQQKIRLKEVKVISLLLCIILEIVLLALHMGELMVLVLIIQG